MQVELWMVKEKGEGGPGGMCEIGGRDYFLHNKLREIEGWYQISKTSTVHLISCLRRTKCVWRYLRTMIILHIGESRRSRDSL